MGYFQVRYDSRVVIYDRRGFIRLANGIIINTAPIHGTIFVILRHLCWSKISFAALVPEDRKYALRLERKWSRS